MKRVILSMVVIATIALVSCKNEAKKETNKTEQITSNKVAYTETTFGVRGNCGMCKNTIEKSVNSIDGVKSAEWNKLRKQVKVSFDGSQTNLDAIHSAIAGSGYDTDKKTASEEIYNSLPGCCQYDREMAMSLKGNVKPDANSSH